MIHKLLCRLLFMVFAIITLTHSPLKNIFFKVLIITIFLMFLLSDKAGVEKKVELLLLFFAETI